MANNGFSQFMGGSGNATRPLFPPHRPQSAKLCRNLAWGVNGNFSIDAPDAPRRAITLTIGPSSFAISPPVLRLVSSLFRWTGGT